MEYTEQELTFQGKKYLYVKGIDEHKARFIPLLPPITTDYFEFVKSAAHDGILVSVKLVWSFKFWRWMYKYQVIWTLDNSK